MVIVTDLRLITPVSIIDTRLYHLISHEFSFHNHMTLLIFFQITGGSGITGSENTTDVLDAAVDGPQVLSPSQGGVLPTGVTIVAL